MREGSPAQFHVLSFEGPDAYARAGGLATRVEGLTQAFASLGFETHLWFVGDPALRGYERAGGVHLHRWCQWVSRHHPGGVYDGEEGKYREFARSLPPYLVREVLLPHLRRGRRAVVLAEEWHTVHALLCLHGLLVEAGVRDQVAVLWNANNTFGFDRIPWERLREAAAITTVSRYMRQRMQGVGVEAVVVPNGLPPDAFETPEPRAVDELRRRLRPRTVLAKMARWDPGKRWLGAIEIVHAMKREGWHPLLVARGGSEPHGEEVLAAARARGLTLVERSVERPGAEGLLAALAEVDGAEVVSLRRHVDGPGRRVLFRASDAVLANSEHEPFGLVGLEAMAAGGVACTGCSGEDYALPAYNALVLQTAVPQEFLALFGRLRGQPHEARALRQAGRATARHFAWEQVLARVLLPRLSQLGATGLLRKHSRVPQPAQARRCERADQAAAG